MLAGTLKQHTSRRNHWGLMALGYGALIVYGSLYPFSGWVDANAPFEFLFNASQWVRRPSLGDIVTNLLAYVPLGFFAFRHWHSTRSARFAAARAISAALAVSLGIEVLQGYLPTRNQSSVDLVLNLLSGIAGVALARLPSGQGRLPILLRRVHADWFLPGRLTDIALLALAAWVITQLLPLVPSLDIGKFRAALAPLGQVLAEPASFNGWHALAETLSRTGIGIVALAVVRLGKPAFAALALLVAALLLAQIPIIGRQLLPEVLVASVLSLLAISALKGRQLETRASWSFFLLFSGLCISQALRSKTGGLTPFNWIPFASSLENPAVGISELTSTIGLAAALVWSARTAAGSRRPRWLGWAAGLLIATGALALELNQRDIVGRTGDVTMPLLLAITWGIAWRYAARASVSERPAIDDSRAAATHEQSTPTAPDRGYVRAWRPRSELLTIAAVGVAIGLASQLPFVPYNVRELIYAGHPLRSAVLLSLALYLTLAVPAWLAALCRQRPAVLLTVPFALLLNAALAWIAIHNAVPSESVHDIVGAPVLHWPEPFETALRFIALHTAFTLLVTGSALLAMQAYVPRRWPLLGGWLAVFVVLAPALYWAIVTQAATDNLTELMQGGGTPAAAALLAMAGLLGFAPGSLAAACMAFARRHLLVLFLGGIAALAAAVFLLAGTESTISKNGQHFSALQFLLSTDRKHYAGPAELAARYAVAYLLLTAIVAVFQFGVWRFIAMGRTQTRTRTRHSRASTGPAMSEHN